jgi:hypothetical protein
MFGGIADFTDWFTDNVTITPFVSLDGYGNRVFSTGGPVTYKGRVQLGSKWLRDAMGQQIVARGVVYLDTSGTVPSVRDLLTLPAKYAPQTPPILDVRTLSDEAGQHHVVVAF